MVARLCSSSVAGQLTARSVMRAIGRRHNKIPATGRVRTQTFGVCGALLAEAQRNDSTELRIHHGAWPGAVVSEVVGRRTGAGAKFESRHTQYQWMSRGISELVFRYQDTEARMTRCLKLACMLQQRLPESGRVGWQRWRCPRYRALVKLDQAPRSSVITLRRWFAGAGERRFIDGLRPDQDRR